MTVVAVHHRVFRPRRRWAHCARARDRGPQLRADQTHHGHFGKVVVDAAWGRVEKRGHRRCHFEQELDASCAHVLGIEASPGALAVPRVTLTRAPP